MSTPDVIPPPTDPLEYFEWFVGAFTDFGYHVKRNRPGDVHVQCPGHNDVGPSLHLTLSADKILMTCFGACGRDAEPGPILARVYLRERDLFLPDPDSPTVGPRLGSPAPPSISEAAEAQPAGGVRARPAFDEVPVSADGRSPENIEIRSPPTASENVPSPTPIGRRDGCWDWRTS